MPEQESPYLRQEIENHSDEPEYVNDLRILRRFIHNGSFGYRQSNDVVFQRLKTRYPEAYSAFGSERRREVLERCKYSPYIELQRSVYPNNPAKRDYLDALKRLRHHMIMFGLGYGDRIMAMAFTTLKIRYPQAYDVFRRLRQHKAIGGSDLRPQQAPPTVQPHPDRILTVSGSERGEARSSSKKLS